MTLRFAEVVLIRLQYHQAQGSKIRPAIVLLDTGDDDIVAAPVTSQSRISEFDIALAEWRAAGLNAPSFVRMHKLTVLSKADIVRRIGICSTGDRAALRKACCRAFCPISKEDRFDLRVGDQFSVGVRSSLSMTSTSTACLRLSSFSPSWFWTASIMLGPGLPALASPSVIHSSLKS